METTFSTSAMGGLVFDYYDEDNFKFAAIIAGASQVVIGHHTSRGWFMDAISTRKITPGTDYRLGVSLRGSTVSVTLDGQAVVGTAYNSVVVDVIGLLHTTVDG